MNLLSRFENFLHSELHLHEPRRILLAVSGGMDSMAMLHLFRHTGHELIVAHCNFSLRGEESDEDCAFVQQYCALHSIPFFNQQFDTAGYAKENKVGIQEAARDLRYAWFSELLALHNLDLIATAHHISDVAETLLFHITRGTGISGLHGIPARHEKIIRPLLFATKEEIEIYCAENGIAFRNDSSNDSNKYSRNKIRNLVIPVLKEINPLFEKHIHALTQQVGFAEKIYRSHLDETWKACSRTVGTTTTISIPALLQLDHLPFYLFEFLRPFGFNTSQASGIGNALQEESGKRFYSATHLLVKDRDNLLVSKLPDADQAELTIDADTSFIQLESTCLKLEHLGSPAGMHFSEGTFLLDLDLLDFPLTLRKWRNGDHFVPLGMKDRKKVSDFFIDEKISLVDKQEAWLLCSGSEIACVFPYRIADGFKLTSRSTHILKLSF